MILGYFCLSILKALSISWVVIPGARGPPKGWLSLSQPSQRSLGVCEKASLMNTRGQLHLALVKIVFKREKLLLNVIPVAGAKVKQEYCEFLKAVNIKGFIDCCLCLHVGKTLT